MPGLPKTPKGDQTGKLRKVSQEDHGTEAEEKFSKVPRSANLPTVITAPTPNKYLKNK